MIDSDNHGSIIKKLIWYVRADLYIKVWFIKNVFFNSTTLLFHCSSTFYYVAIILNIVLCLYLVKRRMYVATMSRLYFFGLCFAVKHCVLCYNSCTIQIMSFSRRVKIKIWKTIENAFSAVSPSPTTYNMNTVWILFVKVCLSEHNLSIAYLITFTGCF